LKTPPSAAQFTSGYRDKRVHVVLPIRVSYWQDGARHGAHLACTYDIGPNAARVTGLRDVCNVGDIITVERGRNKALFRVRWIGKSELRGQFGIECVEEEKTPWALELEEAEETYESMFVQNPAVSPGRTPGKNRRRVPRFMLEDATGLLNPLRSAPLPAQVQDISEHGCQLTVPSIVMPGSRVELNLKVSEVPITLQGKIRYAAQDLVSGVEFHGIRRGDRPLLQSLLRRLQHDSREASLWNLEVVGASV
jgi:hypothetical protein